MASTGGESYWWSLTPPWEWHLSITEVLLAAVVLLGSYWAICRVQHFSLWRRHGIPGPPPSFLFGNLLQIRTKKKDILAVQTEWLEKYGNVCGYYTGYRPTLLVADLEMLRQILIKDFPSFANRARYFLAKKPYSDMIIDMRDHQWKFLRRLTNSVFSRTRLKMMLGLMQESVDDFLSVVSEHADNGQDIDVFSVSQRLTLDIIGRCALAMKLDCLMNPQEPLLLLVRRFFKFAISPLVVVAMVLPGLAPWLRFFRSSTDAALVEKAVTKNLRDVLARRRATPHQDSMDFLQLLIDASGDTGMIDNSTLEMTDQSSSSGESLITTPPREETCQSPVCPVRRTKSTSDLLDQTESPCAESLPEGVDALPTDSESLKVSTRKAGQEPAMPLSDEDVAISTKDSESIKARQALSEDASAPDCSYSEWRGKKAKGAKSSSQSSKKTRDAERPRLTDDEVVSNAYMFVLAGYETTANAIAFTCYTLARHPEWQDKCYSEIQDVMEDKTQLSYEDIGRLHILDRVFQEALRLYPPVPSFVSREAGRTCNIGGVTIPQGVNVTVPVWHIHHHPELWPQPYLFDPDRFLPERKKGHHPLAYLPFGAGPRNCLGLRFARLEVKLVIALLLKEYVITLAPSVKDPLPVGVRTVTLSPTEGVLLQVRRRERLASPDD